MGRIGSEGEKNGEKNYDEYQIMIRHRLAFQSLMLTFALIVVNALVKSRYDWAVPGIEAIVLIALPTLYFITGAIFRNAYIGRREKSPWLTTGLFWILAASELVSFFAGTRQILQDGRLSYGCIPLVLFVLFAYLAAILTVKGLMDSRSSEE